MIQLARHSDCTACPLHAECQSVCVPTTLFGPAPRFQTAVGTNADRGSRALYILGEAPGELEDRRCEPFIGRAGELLRRLYIGYFRLDDRADVWIANAVRCRPPGNKTPTKGQIKSCRPWMLEDLAELQSRYDEVIVLAVGAVAIQSLCGESLRSALRHQGEPIATGHRMFATYHPAFILREPSQALTVKRHLEVLVDYLDGKLGYDLPTRLKIKVAPICPI